MSEVQPVPQTHEIIVTISKDRTVRVEPDWKDAVHHGDSVVWSFKGHIEPSQVPVVALEPSPGAPGKALAEDEITASDRQVRWENAREGTYECRYGFRTESGDPEFLKCLTVSPKSPKGKPGVQVAPPPPDRD